LDFKIRIFRKNEMIGSAAALLKWQHDFRHYLSANPEEAAAGNLKGVPNDD
jgi:hypothetical protein